MAREIALTQGQVAIVDDEDYEHLAQFRWHAHKRRGDFYAARNIRREDGERRVQFMHRDIMLPPDYDLWSGVEVDHEDQNGLNNQRHNLRMATKMQNSQNSRKYKGGHPTLKGISMIKKTGRWISVITVNKVRMVLGMFDDPVDAAKAYDQAAIEHFGAFASPNFPV